MTPLSLSQAGQAADAKAAGDALAYQSEKINIINDTIHFSNIEEYVYKRNVYFNASFVETALNGYTTYKIPCKKDDFICFSWTAANTPYYGLTASYLYVKENTSGVKSRDLDALHYKGISGIKQIVLIGDTDCKFIYLTLNTSRMNDGDVTIYKNYPNTYFSEDNVDRKFIFPLTDATSVKASYYYRSDNTLLGFTTSGYSVHWIPVKKGDVVKFKNLTLTGLNFVATFKKSSGSIVAINNVATYTFDDDGILCAFDLDTDPVNATLYSVDQGSIDAGHIVGNVGNTKYKGLKCVAFGTSLTYRDLGYRPYLASILGMTIDNQGVGSSYWCTATQGSSNVLYNVQQYAGYSDKKICIIEGCANDWYYAHDLGTYKDTDSDTVCGCLYGMISHVYTQNPNTQIIVILDHFGRDYNSVDCSSAAKNSDDLTQYDYYEEIAKLCNFYGIPVIKEYAIASIGEFGTQYLDDNIHLNALGGQQSANLIADAMQSITPKLQ